MSGPLTHDEILSAAIAGLSKEGLCDRKNEIEQRLQEIQIVEPSKKRPRTTADCASIDVVANIVPILAKADTHWDFCMKEMMWLAADFLSERKRQLTMAKKLATGVSGFHATKESRRVRALAEAELQRRRLAGKIGREVRTWWTKIERVIAYKQKLEADSERRRAMNQQLVDLVKQTERYGRSLSAVQESDDDAHILTIEEALAGSNVRRVQQPTDYARLAIAADDYEIYGESTEDSGSDGSFVLGSEPDDDDETTLREAEELETQERRRGLRHCDGDDDRSYMADPDEIERLQEESIMDINLVLERMREEASKIPEVEEADTADLITDASDEKQPKQVTFALDSKPEGDSSQPAVKPDPGNDADDDGDASDVEDFRDDTSDGSEEFVGNLDAVDDETTIEAEERLGREMSVTDEISMLQREGEMSVDELRKLYAIPDDAERSEKEDNSGDDESSENLSRKGSVKQYETLFSADDNEDQDEFQPDSMEVDDETTLEAEERLGREMSYDEEINLLQKEGEIPVEQLRAMYASMANGGNNSDDNLDDDEGDDDQINSTESETNDDNINILLDSGINDDSAADEFRPEDEVDDETTMEAEERLGRDMSYEEELALLKRESEMSVEELRQVYQGIAEESIGDEENPEVFFDHSSANGNDDGSEEFVDDENLVDDETTMEAEEQLGREISIDDEIRILEHEGEMPIEKLRAIYGHENNTINDGGKEIDRRTGSKRKIFALPNQNTTQSMSEDEGLVALQTLNEMEEKLRKTLATRPFLMSSWVHMREYQQIGLNWLVSIQSRRLNGILADEMGLGKTLQTIALLAYLAAYKGIWGPHLVIVPTSCIVNWETELKRFCPAMKVLCYYGSAKRRKELRTGWTKSNWHHVVITSYQLVVQDAFAFKRKKWYYMILDEAQNIKNFQSQRWQTLINFNTQRRLLLTGTPLQNNLMELWSLLHFLMPHVFRSRKEFSYWFSNPMNNIIEGNTRRSNDLISRLHGIIRPFVLRRLKKDVESQMPGKYEHIIKVQMSRRQMFLYEEFMARSSTRTALKKGGNFMGMMNVLMQLRKVCNHPDLFEPRSVVTPFAMEMIEYEVPSLAVHVTTATNGSTISDHLRLALWSKGMGVPSPERSLSYDIVECEQLQRLSIDEITFVADDKDVVMDEPKAESGMSSELTELLTLIRRNEHENRLATRQFQSVVHSRRCSMSAFPFSLRLLELVQLDVPPLDRPEAEAIQKRRIISTPSELLAIRRTHLDRAEDLDELLKKFVICIPRAGASKMRMNISLHDRKTESFEKSFSEMLMKPLEEYFFPFRRAQARLSSFFPDKKLIQFDAGKLQKLSVLLRDLKHGGHRALIFTQMSKMLDTLEAFLNLNGHTYLRLDGSTGVDRRQRLMDKFNNDEKIFCFILSTRSGGLGINLTGADTVIFYDSDWNPAMDAQAQDRAHRIGQTRDVHIYRLITEHSIEENIWTKAKQKRNLDLIVMDEGKFDVGHVKAGDEDRDSENGPVQDIYTKGGLREILGIETDGYTPNSNVDVIEADQNMTKDQLERAMASLEDEEDAVAMKGAQKEAEEELQEFDENVEYKQETEGDCDNIDDKQEASNDTKQSEDHAASGKEDENATKKVTDDEMVKEFEAWQSNVGMDATAIESSLGPTERYGLGFRESIDPFWSIFAVMEYKRKMEAMEGEEEEIDVDELERVKAKEEQAAIDDGDLLGTHPPPDALPRQRKIYFRERARLRSDRKRRKLTGESWITRIDAISQVHYWYNEDTGEAIWEKPKILVELDEVASAQVKKWNAMLIKPLVHIMEYLIPYPDRTKCSLVCKQWKLAAKDFGFVLHVFPVEMGALSLEGRKLEHNHFRTISEVMQVVQPGDTIELGDGHYWINEPGLTVNFPLRIVGDENDPSHVVIELSGSIRWQAKRGWIEGVTFRRPRISKEGARIPEILSVEGGGRLDIFNSILNNEGSLASPAIVRGLDSKARWTSVKLRGAMASPGLRVEDKGEVELEDCTVRDNGGPGVVCHGSSRLRMMNCRVERNTGFGIRLGGNSRCELSKCRFADNAGGLIDKEIGSTCSPCNGNILFVSSHKHIPKLVPGFRLIRELVDHQTPEADMVPSLIKSGKG